ncbi:hypothetical protein Ddye_024225 [Dipteronia dyeriana]|uniref:Uncharacterized protein n=1 Tax=Dipteronia dyeriana TaxID=168575 RepID=A0AAD9TUX4_9ROSI|nr:hypothetical protein Ddye_024225 [Dipteronia dyeriana]
MKMDWPVDHRRTRHADQPGTARLSNNAENFSNRAGVEINIETKLPGVQSAQKQHSMETWDLEAGTRWRIGNGSTVCINTDRWIPRLSTFRIVSPCVFEDTTTVNTLMLQSGGWNVPLIKASFFEDDVEKILGLPIASTRTDDIMIWHFDKGGHYSVQNGYKVSQEIEKKVSPSSNKCVEDWWKTL